MKPVSRSTAILPAGTVDTSDLLKEKVCPLTTILSSGTLHRPRACLGSLGWLMMCENSLRCSEIRNVPGEVSSRSEVRSKRTSKEGSMFGFCTNILLNGVCPSVESELKASSITLLIGERFASSNERPKIPTTPCLKKLNPSALKASIKAMVLSEHFLPSKPSTCSPWLGTVYCPNESSPNIMVPSALPMSYVSVANNSELFVSVSVSFGANIQGSEDPESSCTVYPFTKHSTFENNSKLRHVLPPASSMSTKYYTDVASVSIYKLTFVAHTHNIVCNIVQQQFTVIPCALGHVAYACPYSGHGESAGS